MSASLSSLAFLVPEIHGQPTGGNIYNRRIITELPDEIDTAVIRVGTSPPSHAPADVILVDSLLARNERVFHSLRSGARDAVIVLVAHYLHCVDPGAEASPAAETERTLLPLFDGIVTTSAYTKEALTNEGIPERRVAVVPPGLHASYREPVRGSVHSDSPEVLTVANLIPGKGLPDLIEGLSSLVDVDWSWTLVGDDQLEPDFADRVRDRLRASPIRDRSSWLGRVPPADLRARYDRSDIFVLPSHFETCSMATREAMARGLPVVAYDVGGLSENVGDTEAGKLVPHTNVEALTAALRPVLKHASVRERMGDAARRRSETFPSWSDAAARLRSVLRTWVDG